MADIFGDNPPSDLKRSKQGWLKPANAGQNRKIAQLKSDNADLQDRLAALEELVTGITNKKSKKSG